jgi:twitching motility protein PilT
LLQAYKRGTKDLRLEILDAFARIPDPRVTGLLDTIVKADPDPLVQEKAIRVVARLAGEPDPGDRDEAGGTLKPVDFSAIPEASVHDLLRHARAIGASDLHIAAGTVPHVRIHGRLSSLPLPVTDAERARELIRSILSGDRPERLERERQIDFCYRDAALGRFRTNVFYERRGMNAVFRLVPQAIPTLRDIGLPENLWDITNYSQGLVLVTGSAGCGKSTTLAALVDHINQNKRCHILTIEDPIEYVHANKESLVNQREIPSHSVSFARALRQALREDPDVVLVGEMRDLETIALALTASETGHLVLATLHTTTAATTVDRIINAFPPEQQGQTRMTVADSLRAVISQTLLPHRDGNGRVAAFEILRNTPSVAGLIREGRTFQIPTAMQTGAGAGMTLMDAALLQLVRESRIDPRVAHDRALRKEPFEPFLSSTETAEGVA